MLLIPSRAQAVFECYISTIARLGFNRIPLLPETEHGFSHFLTTLIKYKGPEWSCFHLLSIFKWENHSRPPLCVIMSNKKRVDPVCMRLCVHRFKWPFSSYISASIVYVSRSSNTAIIPVWAGLTLRDLSATVCFNNMQGVSHTPLILSSVYTCSPASLFLSFWHLSSH